MDNFKSPRPTPQFFREPVSFSHKKDLHTPRDTAPPRPPVKSAPPISRLFPHKFKEHQKAHAVSFRSSESSFLNSPHYNEGIQDLYFDQCFEIDCKIGVGSFGEVFKVCSREDGKFYAVKRFREKFRGECDRTRKLEEVKKHEELPKHQNCVEFHKAWEEKGHLYLLTELCHMSLQQFSEVNHDIPESVIWDTVIDLLQGLKHLHNHNLIHMDIKPANIFVSFDGVCKLGDFGLMLELDKGDLSEAQEGDPKYLAPEILQGRYGKPADVFSLGITFLELACDLELPKGGDLWHQLRSGNIPKDITQNLSDDLRYVIYTMMDPDVQHRPTLDQILAIPVVRREWKRRRRELLTRKMWSGLVSFYHMLYMVFLMAWLTVAAPFKYAHSTKKTNGPQSTSTPTVKKHPSYWDHSFSDDDCFTDDVSITNNSIGVPILNSTTTSSDEEILKHRISQLNGSGRNSLVFSPSIAETYRLPINPWSSSPINGTYDTKLGRYTPPSTPSSINSSIGHPSHTPNNSSNGNSLLDNDDIPIKPGIEPKNLMVIFDDAALSDSD